MKKIKLRDLCFPEQVGKYGIPASAEEFSLEKVRYLRISDIDDKGNLLNNDKKSVSSDDLDKYILEEGDIVFARTGNSTGRAYFHEDKNGKLAFAGFLIKYGIDPSKINPKFLKYYTISNEYKQWVNNLSVGSTRGNMNAQTFADCPVPIIERTQQNLLVDVLSALDDKIELNNKINASLEAMAKTLYDYWFVQFDFPNAEGKPYKSSGGEMVYNEVLKREIPKGWEHGNLSDLGEIIGGSTPQREMADYFSKTGTAWITPKDLSQNKGNKFIAHGELDVSEKGIKNASLRIMPKGTVLLSTRAPVGYLAISQNTVTTNQGFKSFVPTKGYSSEFIYYSVKNLIPTIENNAVGSTFKEISGSILKGIAICLPNKKVIDHYNKIIAPVFNKQELLEQQNQELASIRDWLLPMLMNGQVTVKDAFERVEEELGMVADGELKYGKV